MERLQAARSELTELERLAAEQRERKVAQGSSSPNVARGVRNSIAKLKGEIGRLTRDTLFIPASAAGNLDDDNLNSGSSNLRNSGTAPRKIAHVPMEPHERDVVINKDSNAQDTYDLFSTLPIGSIVHFADKYTVDGKLYQYTLIDNCHGRGPYIFQEVGMQRPRLVSINPLNRMPEDTFEMRVPASTISAACSSKNPMLSSAPARTAVGKPSDSGAPRETAVEDLLRDGEVTLDTLTSPEDFERIISAVERTRSKVVYVGEDGKKRVATLIGIENHGSYLRVSLLFGGSRAVNAVEYSDSMLGKILVPRSVVHQDSQSKAPKKSAPVRYDVNDEDSMTPRAFCDKLVIGKTKVKLCSVYGESDGIAVGIVENIDFFVDTNNFYLRIRIPGVGSDYYLSSIYTFEIVD